MAFEINTKHSILINTWHIKFVTEYSISSDSYKKLYLNANQVIGKRF